MSTHRTDVVGEYLHEVELRLRDLPLLQRRELLADLEAHIAEVRQNAHSEGELIEVLERLGSPDVVAAAAYEEAGLPSGPGRWRGDRAEGPAPLRVPGLSPAPVNRKRPAWLIALVVLSAVLLLCGLFSAFFVARSSPSEPSPAPAGPPPAPTATR